MRLSFVLRPLAVIGCFATSAFALPSLIGSRTELETVEGEVTTNGERIAGGIKGLLKPKRLFDPTKPRPLQPRSSAITPPPNSIQIAAGPSGGPSTKKRDAGVGGFSVDSEGFLTYTTDSSQLAAFEFTDVSKTALQWVSTVSSADLTLGQTYPVYVAASGNIYYVKAGTPPSGAVTEIFNTARYDGDLNPVLPIPGGSSAEQFQWISDPNGDILLATDAATASAVTSTQTTVLLVQYFTYGSTPSIAAAQASLAQGGLLVNPLYLYARDITGRFGGWLGDRGFDNFFPYYDVSLRTTFYAPNLGSGSATQLYYVDQDSNGHPRTWALTESSPSTGAYVIGAQVSTGSNMTDIADFNIPTSISGLVTASTPASANSPFYGHNNGDKFLRTCDTADHCAVFSGRMSLCVEAVRVTGKPSVCDEQARQYFFTKYYAQSYLHVYDPSAPTGPTTGYIGLYSSNGYSAGVQIYPTADAGSYVYLDLSVQGQRIQHLYSMSDQSVYYTYGVGNNQVFAGQLEYGGTFSPVQTAFNLPADPQKGGGSIITVVPPAYPATSDKSWQFYVGTIRGVQTVLSCANSSCTGSGATEVRPLCLELVPVGWNPTACAAASAAGQTFNPYT